jgi:TonB family protein
MPASVPQPFADIVRDCLRLDPGDRPTLRAISTRLEGGDTSPVPATERDTGPIPAAKVTVVSVPVSEPVSPARPEEKPAPRTSLQGPRRSAGSNRGLIWLGAGGVVVLAMIAFFTARGHRSEAPAPTVTQMPAATAPAPQAAVPRPPAVQSPASNGSPVKGEAAERVMPDVSSSASRTIHGKVVVKVRVTVDPNGVVSGASIRSAGSRYFGAKALEAARKWRFRPPQANSQAVASEWTLEFIFRQNGSSVNPVQVTP